MLISEEELYYLRGVCGLFEIASSWTNITKVLAYLYKNLGLGDLCASLKQYLEQSWHARFKFKLVPL